MKTKSSLQKYQVYLAPLLVGLLIVATASAFLKPKVALILASGSELSQKKQALARLTQKVAALQGLDPQTLNTKTQLALKALPVEKEVPWLIRTVKAVAEETGVVLGELNVDPGELASASAKPSQAEGKSNLTVLEFDLNAEGALELLVDFLARLEAVLPLMKLTDVAFGQASEGVFQLSLASENFVMGLPPTMAVTDQPLASIGQEEEDAYQELVSFKPTLGEAVMPSMPVGKEDLFNL